MVILNNVIRNLKRNSIDTIKQEQQSYKFKILSPLQFPCTQPLNMKWLLSSTLFHRNISNNYRNINQFPFVYVLLCLDNGWFVRSYLCIAPAFSGTGIYPKSNFWGRTHYLPHVTGNICSALNHLLSSFLSKKFRIIYNENYIKRSRLENRSFQTRVDNIFHDDYGIRFFSPLTPKILYYFIIYCMHGSQGDRTIIYINFQEEL